jgi:predicted enzyme related to lactoylglutathione lyase
MTKTTQMHIIDRFLMFIMIVSDMPRAQAFYADTLGLKITKNYRQDDDHWWVSLTPPEGEITITITTYHENIKPGTMTLYFSTSDLTAAHKQLNEKGVKVNEIKDNLYGPGSGVKWFNIKDPDENQVILVQE